MSMVHSTSHMVVHDTGYQMYGTLCLVIGGCMVCKMVCVVNLVPRAIWRNANGPGDEVGVWYIILDLNAGSNVHDTT